MPPVWLIDFDDTLASGPVTWGYRRALPKLIRTHRLPLDSEALAGALLVAQEQSNGPVDLGAIVDAFFDRMGWPAHLRDTLLQDVQDNYAPELFDDAPGFMDQLRRAGQTVFILSNNPRTPAHAAQLGLSEQVAAVITPHMLPGAGPKPERSLWDGLARRFPQVADEGAVVVGDDPWSDVAFAQACALPVWLVDRDDRFGGLDLGAEARRVRSLADISLA